MEWKRVTKKNSAPAPVPPDSKGTGEEDALVVRLNERIAALENELLIAREELQTRQEEMEVQAEELETHFEALRVTNDELEKEIGVRQQSEDTLRKSQFILAKSQEMAHVGNWAWNVHSGEMSWSDESFRIFGYRPQELKPGWGWLLSRIYPDDKSMLSTMAAAVVRDGKARNIDVRTAMSDGSRRYVNVLADKAVRDAAGCVSRVYGIFQDVTERKRAENALQEKQEGLEIQAEEIEAQNEELRANNEELEELTRILQQREIELSRLAAIVTSSDDAIIGKTLDGTITSWNAGAEKIYGYTAAEAIGRPIDILIPPWLSGEEDLLKKIGQGQRVVHHETQRLTKDGRMIDVSITISPIFDGDGTLIGASTIARDVTEARKAENALKKSRFIMAKSQEIAHVGNWAWNVQTGVMNGSDENYRIYGYQPHEVCPTEDWLKTLVHADDQASFNSFIESVRRDGMRGSIDYRIVKPDGDVRYLMTVADRTIRDKAGKIKWVYGITQDITRRKQTEGALKEAKTQAELYLDLMGHDISNLHQIALSQLELAEEIMNDEGKIGVDEIEMITTPIETLNRSARLIDNVRKIQKLRAGEYRTETVDLGKVLGEVVAEGRASENGVTINYMPVPGCLVKANPLIKEAFANLVNNAIKHSHGRPTIDVGVSTASENGSAFCQITIIDDGPGIPDEKKGEIFYRFKRGQTQAKGTGLGLYIVKTLVENFKGRVRVEDRVPGDYTKGSKFIVDLPVAEE